MLKMKAGKYLAVALKTAIGSCTAILAAEQFHLDFASSAGIIALLTLINTRWDTLRLSAVRLISFFATVILAWMIFSHMSREWITYGVFVFLLVGISLFVGWQNTMSVNAVIGTHFWTTHDFGAATIWNEFCLVFIGITVAVLLNLFQRNQSRKKQILQDMRYVEARLQDILEMLADYLMQRENEADVWEEILWSGLMSMTEIHFFRTRSITIIILRCGPGSAVCCRAFTGKYRRSAPCPARQRPLQSTLLT